jgi:hypothetical protein
MDWIGYVEIYWTRRNSTTIFSARSFTPILVKTTQYFNKECIAHLELPEQDVVVLLIYTYVLFILFFENNIISLPLSDNYLRFFEENHVG